jgi:hypothetical protein
MYWTPANKGAESGRCSIHLVVMSAIWEGAQFIDERLIPPTLNQFDHTVFALRSKWCRASFFRFLLRLYINTLWPTLIVA